jgi:hypothetical protein
MVRRTNANTIGGKYDPINPAKYVGTYPIIYRSSWELAFMRMADKHPNIVSWASEPVKIPYYNPVRGKYTVYVPDFLIVYEDRNGKRHQEMIEIKPRSQTFLHEAKSKKDQLSAAVNMAKWKMAGSWCAKHNIRFRVINEDDIFMKSK